MGLMQLFRPHGFSHGLHPPEHKELTERLPIRRLPFAPMMVIPLSQHLGAPAVSIVREGQEVVRGEPLAEAGGFVSVPMHAPATGIVDRIDLAPNARGNMTPSIFLKLYPGEGQDILFGAPQDIDAMSSKELIDAVQATGVVGLGGAAFPTHVKLAVPEGKSIDTIIVNGCECEPYLTTDHQVMLEWGEDILDGIRIVQKTLQADRVVVGVEANKVDAAEAMRKVVGDLPGVEVMVLETKYPQGAEKMLIKAILGREVPSGSLPYEVGVGVFNVATLAQIGELLPKHQGLIERVVTITGPGVRKPGNYLIALGTPLRFALEQAGLRPEAREVILGGPMMGTSVADWETPITKGVTGILVFTVHELREKPKKIYPCIKCGACVQACPINLNPSQLGLLARIGDYEQMETHYHLNDCFECGSCTYVCPSNIPLVQQFRVAKTINRENKAKNNE